MTNKRSVRKTLCKHGIINYMINSKNNRNSRLLLKIHVLLPVPVAVEFGHHYEMTRLHLRFVEYIEHVFFTFLI